MCKVSWTTWATFSCGIEGLRPRPVLTLPTPFTPSVANWCRQPSTVERDTPRALAVCSFALPSAAINNPLASRTMRCGRDGEAAIFSSISLSCDESARAGAGGWAMPDHTTSARLLVGHYTSWYTRTRTEPTSPRWAPRMSPVPLGFGPRPRRAPVRPGDPVEAPLRGEPGPGGAPWAFQYPLAGTLGPGRWCCSPPGHHRPVSLKRPGAHRGHPRVSRSPTEVSGPFSGDTRPDGGCAVLRAGNGKSGRTWMWDTVKDPRRLRAPMLS